MFDPSIVPSTGETVYVVEDDFGPKLGRCFRETDSARSDRETTLDDLYAGQYNDPLRVIAFNVFEGWCRDVSCEFASELQRRANIEGVEINRTLAEFVEYYTCAQRQLSLRLV